MLVPKARFELTTPCASSRRSTGLSYLGMKVRLEVGSQCGVGSGIRTRTGSECPTRPSTWRVYHFTIPARGTTCPRTLYERHGEAMWRCAESCMLQASQQWHEGLHGPRRIWHRAVPKRRREEHTPLTPYCFNASDNSAQNHIWLLMISSDGDSLRRRVYLSSAAINASDATQSRSRSSSSS